MGQRSGMSLHQCDVDESSSMIRFCMLRWLSVHRDNGLEPSEVFPQRPSLGITSTSTNVLHESFYLFNTASTTPECGNFSL